MRPSTHACALSLVGTLACRQVSLNIVELREYMGLADLLKVDFNNNLFGDNGVHVRSRA